MTPQMAEWIRNLHPLRLQYEMFSSRESVHGGGGEDGREGTRGTQARSVDNPFIGVQEKVSKQIVSALDAWRDSQEALSEAIFLAVYGSPALQAAVGIDPRSEPSRRQEMSAKHSEMLQARIAELKSRIGEGGLREAAIRGLLYVGSARGMVDERSLEALRQVRRNDSGARMTLAAVQIAGARAILHAAPGPRAALAAIPKLLPDNAKDRLTAFAAIREVLSAGAEISGEVAKRLEARRRTVRRGCNGSAGDRLECRPFDPKAWAS